MRRTALCLVLALSLLVPAALDAQARVSVVHGISGGALGLPADLPVDVWVNGAPFLTDFQFTDIAGPVDLPAGDYEIGVFLAGADPEVDAPVLTLDAHLSDGQNVSIVAHLVPGPDIALTPFVNNNARQLTDPISPRISPRSVRLTVTHAADFPRVAVNRLLPVDPTFANGEQLSYDLDPGSYSFWLSVAGGERPTSFAPVSVDLASDTHYFVYAVGSPLDGSFQLLISADDLP